MGPYTVCPFTCWQSSKLFRLMYFAGCLTAALLAVFTSSTTLHAQTTPVTGWFDNDDDVIVIQAEINGPIIGDGTANSADNVAIWAALANPITLSNGQEVVLSGSVQLVGVNAGGGDGMRLGLFDGNNWHHPMNNPFYNGLEDEQFTAGGNTVPAGWRGFIATVPSYPAFGFLDAKNPNNTNNVSFIAIDSGPFPTPNPRTFRLATGRPERGSLTDGTYDFELRVANFGHDQVISVQVVSQDPVPGDFDADRDIDGRDFLIWQRGESPSLGSLQELQAWQTNYGQIPIVQPRYEWSLSATIPPAGDTVPSFIPTEFDRVGFLLSGSQDADQAIFNEINITRTNIQTLILDVSTNTGAMSIRNSSGIDFNLVYYEVTSDNGNFDHLANPSGWVSLDDGEGGDPLGSGWDEIGSPSVNVIGELNLEGSLTLSGNGASIGLGNAFNTATAVEMRDLVFHFALDDGSLLRGIVNYNSTSSMRAVPEQSSFALVLLATLGCGVRRPPVLLAENAW
jgi:hypothetical protein